MPFDFEETGFEGLLIIRPRVFPDERGIFKETFKASEFANAGVVNIFKQDNLSQSRRGGLRGLHFQHGEHAQGKLVQLLTGAAWDVAVDIRPGSKTFGQWFGIELRAEDHVLFWIPPGFAHGFVTLTDDTIFAYKCTEEYHKQSEGGIRWDDPYLEIAWPIKDVIVSEKDQMLPYFKNQNFSL